MANYRHQERYKNEKISNRSDAEKNCLRKVPEKSYANNFRERNRKNLKNDEELSSYMFTYNEDDWRGY
ncbi:MAG TPA: hypothetical protein VIQ00_11090 [Chitinophagaceae bacterium]|jgi:hypothetical protein